MQKTVMNRLALVSFLLLGSFVICDSFSTDINNDKIDIT